MMWLEPPWDKLPILSQWCDVKYPPLASTHAIKRYRCDNKNSPMTNKTMIADVPIPRNNMFNAVSIWSYVISWVTLVRAMSWAFNMGCCSNRNPRWRNGTTDVARQPHKHNQTRTTVRSLDRCDQTRTWYDLKIPQNQMYTRVFPP